jgi:hemerythrin-like metal-binding protein
MALIEWEDKFRVGVPAVDHEHRELIDLINTLHGRLAGEGTDTAVTDFLGEIYTRIAAHFALEEKIMRARRYDQYGDHKADHERLLDEIRDIMDDYEDRRSYSEDVLGARLRDWFGTHFGTHDARLHQHLAEPGQA